MLKSNRPKFGVLHYSYAGLQDQVVAKVGHASVNLGDYMQTLAVRGLYRRMGIADDDVVAIDRDTIQSYQGEPVILVMNACFFRHSFPISDKIVPVFIGFQTQEKIIVEFTNYFRQYAPIGCRDTATCALFEKHGIAAFVTGCLTLTFESRPDLRSRNKIVVAYGSGAGAFPVEALASMPAELGKNAEFVFQRQIVQEWPFSAETMRKNERFTSHLLNYYREEAALVVTPLHHAAAPCMASGIPVVLCRKKADPRFGYLSSLITVHIAPNFSAIDWLAKPVDISEVKVKLMETAISSVSAARALH